MGRFAIGTSAFGNSSGVEVKVFRDRPGPHKMSAWKSGKIDALSGMVGGCMESRIVFPGANLLVTASWASFLFMYCA